MFQVGDTVRNVTANVVGVVIDVDGDTVYIEQANGCEVDFAASALVLESAFQAKHNPSRGEHAGSAENDQLYAAVIDNLYPAVIELGQACHAGKKAVPGIAPKSWESLSALQRLNTISEATAIPVKTWIESNRPAAKTSLATLQLSVLAAKGKKPRS